MFNDVRSTEAGSCYDHPKATLPPKQQIRQTYDTPKSRRTPRNDTIPEEFEKTLCTERAYDVIRTEFRSGEQYDVPTTGTFQQSSAPSLQQGWRNDVINPCYAVSRQENQHASYDIPKNRR